MIETARPILIQVGDERRPRLGRAILGCLLVAGAFEVFVFGVKVAPSFRQHVPWTDDPYDVFTSFAIFFVPAIVALCAVRVPLARRFDPLPLGRVAGLLRACRLLLAIMTITLLSDWTATVAGTDRAVWTVATPVALAALAMVSALVALVTVDVRRAGRRLPQMGPDPTAPDWLADATHLAIRWLQPRGRLGREISDVVRLADRRIGAAARQRPVLLAGLAAAAFGTALAFGAAREEGFGPLLLLFAGVGWCGMFAFLVASGAYLGLVHRTSPAPGGLRRRALDAGVVASAGVPLAVGLRDALWSMAGLDPSRLDLGSLGALLVLVALVLFGVILAAETVVGMHSPPTGHG